MDEGPRTVPGMLPQTNKKQLIQQHKKIDLFSYLAILFPILIPTFHMILFKYLWDHEVVNRENCTCSCFDSIFKGFYEDGVASFKHVYFNTTINTFKIWTCTILFFIGMYEVFKRMIWLFVHKKLRLSMALLFGISFHSNYFSWWIIFNYYNDDFNLQWNHQMFFTITEFISTFIVIYFMDRRISITNPLPLLIVINIAVVHVLCGSLDNFIDNVVLRNGELDQVSRDIPLMMADILYTVICSIELWNYYAKAKSHGQSLNNALFQRNQLTVFGWLTAIIYIALLFILCKTIQ